MCINYRKKMPSGQSDYILLLSIKSKRVDTRLKNMFADVSVTYCYRLLHLNKNVNRNKPGYSIYPRSNVSSYHV